ncbi:Ig-like domain-containing protein [Flavobacterium sp.]|jgi:hypothetical protein|uniref:Ig-like domain-containing protein n=1 Tax=Flavobacterium sp. TaxID=239 RepID=UPI0022BD3C18|nr:Ig-like domain-containing protein [Flavobacterium sp.]MCZ8145964.1 hypothetical protein [Flavobacterium sp.]MCZ8367752.1 hypothetical protein [Flavobacterium sp.]
MTKTIVTSIFILIFGYSCLGQELKTKIVTSDIDNFWMAYDAIHNTTDSLERIKIIKDRYISNATDGLNGMITAREYEDYEFVEAILKYPKYWNSIRPNTANLTKDREQIEHYFTKLHEIYPKLKPTTIYFPIGVFRSAGTYQGNNVLLGAEFMLANRDADLSELPERVRNGMSAYMPFDIPLIALHEQIHTQQQRWEHLSIIHRSVAEGLAEFISTLISQRPLSPGVKFGKQNEKRVLDRYMIEIFRDDDVGNWLSSKNQNELEVNDLGYYIGYEVCERYYNKSTDKKQAIKELIELDYSNDNEFAKILDGSGFLPMTWNEIGAKYESMRPSVIGIKEFTNGSKNVSTKLKTITIEFSAPMSSCCRTIDYDQSKKGEFLKIKKIIGWSEDYRKFSFEVEELNPNTNYHIIISNFAKEDGGNRLAPYRIEFSTMKR